MRTAAMCLLIAAAASAGCLRSTQFKCSQDTDCGATGVCEAVGYCSFPSSACADSGRSFGDSAGQGLSNTCVPGDINNPGPDAGIDAPIDTMNVGCPAPYASVNGSAHRYKPLTNVSWDNAASDCKLTSTSAYLAVPDNAAELVDLVTVAAAPSWIGIDDQMNQGTFVTQKGVPATFLPWMGGMPGPPSESCVRTVSATEITTDKCGTRHAAVCECEP
jgi:hypothetical protein